MGQISNFWEEQSAKIPAWTLLTNLGYQFIPRSERVVKRGNLSTIILPDILRNIPKYGTYSFMGKGYPLSGAAIDKVVHELASPAMN